MKNDHSKKKPKPKAFEVTANVGDAMRELTSLGFVREAEDFDPTREPRPLFSLPAEHGPVVKATVGPVWTTVWRLESKGHIGLMDSAKTSNPAAVRDLAERIGY